MLNDLLGEIMNAATDPNNSRILVALNSIRFIIDNASGEKIVNETKLYSIKNKEKDNIIDGCTIISNKGMNGKILQNPEMLKKLFEKIELCPDEEIMLMTWDHGSSFGIFRQEPTSLNASLARTNVDHNLYQYPYLNLFLSYALEKGASALEDEKLPESIIPIQVGRHLLKMEKTSLNMNTLNRFIKEGVASQYNEKDGKITMPNPVDDTEDLLVQHIAAVPNSQEAINPGAISDGIEVAPLVPEILKNSELNETLKDWLKGRKVGVLLMSNCWMMNMHSMFAFQGTVQCFVAPQGDIDLPGYNINAILREINKTENVTPAPAELASICVSTVDDFYSKAKALVLCPDDPDVTERFKIFAVDLGKTTDGKSNFKLQFDYLQELLIALNTELKAEGALNQELKYFFKYIRSACFDFSRGLTMTIDVVNWIQSLKFTDSSLPREERKLISALTVPMNKFLRAVIENPTSIIINCSSGKKVYEKEDKRAVETATIQLSPSGYSIFFPIADYSDLLKLKDNISSDGLIGQLPEWKNFLELIEPRTTAIFKAP